MRMPRFSVRASMVAVAILAMLTWWLAESYVRGPERARLSRLRDYHEIRQGGWAWLADGYEDQPANHPAIAECRRISTWHTARLRELNSTGIPSAEAWWEEGQRMMEYEFQYQNKIGASGFVRGNYRDFR